MHDLLDKVVIVCGGAGYLGSSVCRTLIEYGAKVVVADINNSTINQLIASIDNDNVRGYELDINCMESIKQLINFTLEHFGALDSLVIATAANAGTSFDEITMEEFDSSLHTNITSTFFMVRESVKAMNTGGSVVLYASMYGQVSPDLKMYDAHALNPNPIEYGVAKAAIIQMVKYLAAYYGNKNIRVNSIAPGPFPSNNVKSKHSEFVGELKGKTMLNRVGQQSETSKPVAFLVSDASSYITGHTLDVNGGWTSF
jgi:NAD(P)-dependent dehydrogenase (short-subunit alcohol dehydrogenase family)